MPSTTGTWGLTPTSSVGWKPRIGGIELLAPGRRRADLEQWFRSDFEAWFSASRILPVDRRVASEWASLVVRSVKMGRPLPTVDSLLAATALAHDLTVVTRNTKDFADGGVLTINPWLS